MKTSVIGLLVAFATIKAVAADLPVKNPAELKAAVASAGPGDQIILADGVWTNVHLLLDKPGTVSTPLRLRAKTPGGVVLTGSSQLTFAAPYVHVEGLFFKNCAPANGNPVVRFQTDDCRFADSAIVESPSTTLNRAAEFYWLFFEGSRNTVDRCFLTGKSSHQPVIGNAIVGARYNTFANSYIKDIPPTRSNGKEIFRIWGYGGNEEIGDDGAFFTIDGNLLDRADGESSEIISFKSNRNRVLNNTIRATRGGITFRSGNYNTVAGNFILGDGRPGCYGMRVTGRYHAIVNNYIADCDYGINVYAGVFIDEALDGRAGGVERAGTPLGRVPNYSWVRSVTIAHNTLVNNLEYDLHMGGTYDRRSPRVLLPAGSLIAENLIIKTNRGVAVTGVTPPKEPSLARFDFAPNTYFANLVQGGSVEFAPARDGFVEKDLKLKPGPDGIYRGGAANPPVRAGVKFPGTKAGPLDHLPRREAPGVGAEEFASTTAQARPLTPDDVGPEWIKARRKAGEKF